ncbi:MAG: hypothetical protein FH749_01295 [Firmicutes bacterium]|nr:hypothetical protein [Bacillota bacterium]
MYRNMSVEVLKMNFFFRDYTSKDWNLLLDMVMALYSEDPEGEPMDADKLARTVRHLHEFPQKSGDSPGRS